MKNTIYYIFLICLLSSFISCEDYTKFTDTLTETIPINYDLKIDGNFTEERTLYESDIKDYFVLPENSKIEKVTILSLIHI